MKYGVLAATEYFGQYSLIELTDAGTWKIVAKGSRQNLLPLAAALNEHDERSQPVNAAAADPGPPWPGLADDSVITVDEVESWNVEQRKFARNNIQARTVGPVTTYTDGDTKRMYSTNAAQLITGAPFIIPKPPNP